jgi:hypothetical protein
MIFTAINLVPNEWWAYESGMLNNDSANHISNMDLAFKSVMGQGLWIIIGSLIAFLIGQIIDVMVFHKIKNMTGEKMIWLRATGSTLVSQFIDSFVVLYIAFYIGNDWPFGRVMAICFVNYAYKFIMAIILTPVIYGAHHLIDNYLGKEEAAKMKLTAAEIE